jgi:hypothetical protein
MENDIIQKYIYYKNNDDDDIKNKRNVKRIIDYELTKIDIKIWVYRKCQYNDIDTRLVWYLILVFISILMLILIPYIIDQY